MPSKARAPAADEAPYFTDDFWTKATDVSNKKASERNCDAFETISLLQDGGILKVVVTPAASPTAGHPPKHSTVHVDYRGWNYKDASLFDESRTPDGAGKDFSFELGKGKVGPMTVHSPLHLQVIKGWDEGVATMAVGEAAVFKLAAEYAYGAGGSPPAIPPNSTLVFLVTLHGYDGEDISPGGDKTIVRMMIDEGEKYLAPVEESTCVGGWLKFQFKNLNPCSRRDRHTPGGRRRVLARHGRRVPRRRGDRGELPAGHGCGGGWWNKVNHSHTCRSSR